MTNGIRVAKPGYPVETANPTQLVFDSAYATLRVQQQGSGTITHASRTVTIPHNLGYVPMFTVTADIFKNGRYANVPISYDQSTVGQSRPAGSVFARSDSTNLYIEADSHFGWSYYICNDYGSETGLVGYIRDFCIVGNNYPTFLDCDGAMRFGSVAISQGQTIVAAEVGFYINDRAGSDPVKWRMYAIDEDNTGDFGSSPFGKGRTDAWTRPEIGPSEGETVYINCITQLQEVVNRSGWSSGNNFALLHLQNNESNEGNGVSDSAPPFSNLRVIMSNNLLDYKYTIFKDRIE